MFTPSRRQTHSPSGGPQASTLFTTDGNLADRSLETGSPMRASLKSEQREQQIRSPCQLWNWPARNQAERQHGRNTGRATESGLRVALQMLPAGMPSERASAPGTARAATNHQEEPANEVDRPAGTRTGNPRRTAPLKGPQSCSRQSCSEHLTP